jgi:two-component system cell cycle response regulator DivK
MAAEKILVTEDSSVIQNITRKVLEFQNYQVVLAKNGQEALEELRKHEYDAILLDITMPIMDGFKCIKAIRAMGDEKKANIPVIAVTGNAKNYSAEEFKAMGFTEFIQKPLNFDSLVEVVNKVVRG